MQKNINPVDKNSPGYLLSGRAMARYALLLLLVFTTINLLLLYGQQGRYLLFSASLPYYFSAFSLALEGGARGSYTVAAIVVSVVVLGVYCASWQFSDKSGWLLTAAILLSIDTAFLVFVQAMLFGNVFYDILDYLCHGWALYHLFTGFRAARRLEKEDYTHDADSQ